MCALLAGDVRSSDAALGGEKTVEPPMGVLVTLVFPPMGDFPLEPTHDDTQQFALDQVIQF